MSKICPQCKAENRDLARFCSNCNAALRIDTPVRYCPSGRHPMDPGWDTCPYCATEAASSSGAAIEPPPLPSPPAGSRRKTVVESRPPRPPTVPESDRASAPPAAPAPSRAASRQKTAYQSEESAGPAAAAAPGLRRIVALLITYTWHADGEVFPIREGRNYLGSDADCEVRVTSDPQLSARHASLIYRGKDFWIDDEKSMNGTVVNGETIEEKQRLPNYSIIKTGATVWTFVTVSPSGEA